MYSTANERGLDRNRLFVCLSANAGETPAILIANFKKLLFRELLKTKNLFLLPTEITEEIFNWNRNII
ncbi:MAG: hypothetical protein LBP59_20795 [Planctomycetaceae bacterium]|nr:hypothetical protein [Planctomycetaceae bacterium]